MVCLTRISYDNTKVAVARILGHRERKITDDFLRLESHFLFDHHFCLVRRPNEKGHVERLLDFGRRNFLVPVPRVDSLRRSIANWKQNAAKTCSVNCEANPLPSKYC